MKNVNFYDWKKFLEDLNNDYDPMDWESVFSDIALVRYNYEKNYSWISAFKSIYGEIDNSTWNAFKTHCIHMGVKKSRIDEIIALHVY